MTTSMSIKWCQKNLQHHSQAVFDVLREKFPHIEMEQVECIGEEHCGLCTDVPFALRNGAVIAAADARGLYAKLVQGMEFMTKPALPGTYAAVMAVEEVATNANQTNPATPVVGAHE